MSERRPKKIQVLRETLDKCGPDASYVSTETVRELVELAEATANYFGYPRKAKPGVHREGRDKFNALIDQLDRFDFGTYAPDELREEDSYV